MLFDLRVAKLTQRFLYTLTRVRYDLDADPNHAIYREKGGVYKSITEICTDSLAPGFQ